MWTRKQHIYRDGAGAHAVAGKRIELRSLLIVTGDQAAEAVTLAANDLGKYLKLACQDAKVAVRKAAAVKPVDLSANSLILLGNAKVNALIRKTKQAANLTYRIAYPDKYRQITGVPLKDPGAGFSVRTIPSPYAKGNLIVLLEGEDKLGMQYAVYDWLEEALGVRFLSPYFEYCPQVKQLRIPLLNYEETGNFPLRRLQVWAYPTCKETLACAGRTLTGEPLSWATQWELMAKARPRTHFEGCDNDPWLWYKNGLRGDITMMTRCVDWLVKNKQNVISWLPEMFGHWPAEISPDYTRYEAMRGLKIIGYVSAGSQWASLKQYADELGDMSKSMCQSKTGESFHHLCFTQEHYWKVVQREIAWYERPENRLRQMAGLVLCYVEDSCSYPAYCMKDRPAVRCKYCGKIPNWKKWVTTMRKTEEILQAKGWNIPVGLVDFGSGSSGVPWGDDTRFGVRPEWDRKIVEHAPSKNNFFSLRPPGDHTCEEMRHYWDFVKTRNRKEGCHLSILKEGENLLMMSSDLPIISPYYFKSREHDFDQLTGDSVTLGHDINYYTTRKLEWLKTLYSFRGQWNYDETWEAFVRNEVDHLFGPGVGRSIVASLKAVSLVLEQDLIWRKTPWNHDVDSYRGIWTYYPYLTHIFINCAQWPITLMEQRRKDGGLSLCAAAAPEEVRLRRRPYREFVDRDYLTVRQEMQHYLKLLAQAEKALSAGARQVQRNKAFFQQEFAYNILGAVNFLGWRLKAVTAFCFLIEAEKHARQYEKEKTLAALGKSLAFLAEAVQELKAYWKNYGVKEETIENSWGNASPAVERVEELYETWQKLQAATRTTAINWNSALIAYVNVNDRYPELFSNKPSIVGRQTML